MPGLFDAQVASEYVARYSWGCRPVTLCPMSEWLLIGGDERARAIHQQAADDALAFVKRCLKTTETAQERDTLYEWLFLHTQEEQAAAIKAGEISKFISRRLREYAEGNQLFRDYAQGIAQGS